MRMDKILASFKMQWKGEGKCERRVRVQMARNVTQKRTMN